MPDLLISGIQHFAFCRRQWALIHIENQWAENYLTIDGKLLHERADDPFFTEKRGGRIISRALPVRSSVYGMTGTCDIVEFHENPDGVPVAGREGLYMPCPVEYKRGHSKTNDADRMQLCAQVLCLEEMFGCRPIEQAYLYYGETKRREAVPIDAELREKTVGALTEMRRLFDRGYTPKVRQTSQCKSCSLHDICLPKLQKYRTAREYTDGIWEDGDP